MRRLDDGPVITAGCAEQMASGVGWLLRVEELHLESGPEQVVKGTVDAALRALAGDLEEARR